ncbi:MAG: alpha/beta fold hydrolase [Firmicutes bacterium]|nr:alpha/beta fold hydrolase [Bacillota bacterium]
MKKISVFFLLLALTIAITACNNNAVNDPEEQQLYNDYPSQEQSRVYEIINERVVIGQGTEWELDGLLTLPIGAGGTVPAVVLVHGSGPADMDATIFENRPFLEIAEYLAANGIAVIRYNKRTFTHGAEMIRQLGGSLTVWAETIEDAILATEILRADPRIDENRVFILGHSLGGALAPRIHAYGGDFAGLILFAGSPRSLLEIIFD